MEDRSQQQPMLPSAASSGAAATTTTAATAATTTTTTTTTASALVSHAIRQLPMHLTVAYTEALLLAPELVQHESDPVLYLRKCHMNVHNAAIMMAVYWTRRKAYFGQRAYLPLLTGTASAAASPAMALGQLDLSAGIPSCCLQVLPRDRMGHAVYFVDTAKIATSLSSEQGLRCLFYQLQRANHVSTLSSTEGIIQLWLVRDHASQLTVLEAFCSLLSGLIQQAMPINIQRLHILSSNPASATIASLTQLVFAKSLCEECVVTDFTSSPQQSLLSKLLFYGLSEDCLPMELGGSYFDHTYNRAMMPSSQHHPAASTMSSSSQLLFSPGGGGGQGQYHPDFSNAPLLHHAASSGGGLYDDERTIPLGSFGTSHTVPSPIAAAAMMPNHPNSLQQQQQEQQDYSNVVAAMLRQRKQQNWLEGSMLDSKLPAATRKRPPTGSLGAGPPQQQQQQQQPQLPLGVGLGVGGASAFGAAAAGDYLGAGSGGDLSEFSSRGSSNTSGRVGGGGVSSQLKQVPPASLLEQQQQQYPQQQRQQQPGVDESAQAAAERAEHLRQRNALYTRRSYHKSKIELQVLQDQVEQLLAQQQNLAQEQERLQRLHSQVDKCLKKQKTGEHTSTTTTGADSTTTNVQQPLAGAGAAAAAEPAAAQDSQEAAIASQNAAAAAPAAELAAPPSDPPAALPSPNLGGANQDDSREESKNDNDK